MGMYGGKKIGRTERVENKRRGVRPLLIIVVERDYLRGTIVWSHL